MKGKIQFQPWEFIEKVFLRDDMIFNDILIETNIKFKNILLIIS